MPFSTLTKTSFALQLTNMKHLETTLKTTHRLGSKLESSLHIGYCDDSGEGMISLESEFKYRIKDHVKAYASLKYSIDGWMYLLGLKVAGIKVKFPLLLLDQ